jgi:hypothetical protein
VPDGAVLFFTGNRAAINAVDSLAAVDSALQADRFRQEFSVAVGAFLRVGSVIVASVPVDLIEVIRSDEIKLVSLFTTILPFELELYFRCFCYEFAVFAMLPELSF